MGPAVGSDPVAAVAGLVKRVLGEDLLPYLKFELTNPASNGHDRFEVDNANDGTSIVVRGNSGVALASGLYSYLSVRLLGCNCPMGDSCS